MKRIQPCNWLILWELIRAFVKSYSPFTYCTLQHDNRYPWQLSILIAESSTSLCREQTVQNIETVHSVMAYYDKNACNLKSKFLYRCNILHCLLYIDSTFYAVSKDYYYLLLPLKGTFGHFEWRMVYF